MEGLLSVISAIVTYFYDANLAPYNTADSPIQINQDILRATIAGSTVNEENGYTLSDEQRALARSMNIEKRVSVYYTTMNISCEPYASYTMNTYHSPNYHPLLYRSWQ